MYSIKWIPLIFLITLLYQLSVIYYLSIKVPSFNLIGWPNTLEKAQQLASLLRQELNQNYSTLLLFHISSILFLQTWCVPGSIIFNLLGGALFGIKVGFITCLSCNVIGASFCYLLSKYFLKNVLETRFKNKLEQIREMVKENKKELFFFLTSSRIFPASPMWLMNVSFPHLDISLTYFASSYFIGIAPWNFIACNAGLIISKLTHTNQILDKDSYIFLFALSLFFILPVIIKSCFKAKQKKI